MTGRPFSTPFNRSFSTTGTPAAGQKLYFYAAGTTTAVDTFADADLTTPNTHPVVADSAGRFPPIFIDDAQAYRIVEKTSTDVEVDDIDDWTVPAPLTLEGIRDELGNNILVAGANININVNDGSDEIEIEADLDDARPLEACIVPVFDTATAVTAGTSKFVFRAPFAMDVYEVRGSLATAQAGNGAGGILTVDINDDGTSILSTKLTIDNTEKTSESAAIPAVLNTAPITIADDSEITFDVDTIGDGTAKGLNVTLIFRRGG